MPRRNRVDPFGDIRAVPQRGTLMGNRGNLHDTNGNIVRNFKRKEWVTCALQFRDRHRQIMAPGRYTELFFLDEATSLAAGHRPCGTCRKDALARFKACWRTTMGMTTVETLGLKMVDQRLHAERTLARRWSTALKALPDGVMVLPVSDDVPHLWWRGKLLEWTFDGYRSPKLPQYPNTVSVVTPKSLVKVLSAGYPVAVHPSAIL